LTKELQNEYYNWQFLQGNDEDILDIIEAKGLKDIKVDSDLGENE
jgi:hypothetical protein